MKPSRIRPKLFVKSTSDTSSLQHRRLSQHRRLRHRFHFQRRALGQPVHAVEHAWNALDYVIAHPLVKTSLRPSLRCRQLMAGTVISFHVQRNYVKPFNVTSALISTNSFERRRHHQYKIMPHERKRITPQLIRIAPQLIRITPEQSWILPEQIRIMTEQIWITPELIWITPLYASPMNTLLSFVYEETISCRCLS